MRLLNIYSDFGLFHSHLFIRSLNHEDLLQVVKTSHIGNHNHVLSFDEGQIEALVGSFGRCSLREGLYFFDYAHALESGQMCATNAGSGFE